MPSTKLSSLSRPLASLSLDLDDKWTYMKTHGDPGWRSFPSYLSTVVPRTLAFLAERRLTITFFVVGQDAALPANGPVLRSLAEAGHEIGNHSFHHEPWLHLYSRQEIEAEIDRADESIEGATGRRPTGFRGPGFSVSPDVIGTLVERGYRYDASTLPTFLGPLARTYYFLTARMTRAEQEKRALLFGSWKEGLRPLKPYRWQVKEGSLTEIPVTTIPLLRTPFHLSYLLYLSSYSRQLSEWYLRLAIGLCRLRGVAPSFLLHPLDFAAPEEGRELQFFPGMQLPLAHKLSVASRALELLGESFELVPMGVQVAAWRLGQAPAAREVVMP